MTVYGDESEKVKQIIFGAGQGGINYYNTRYGGKKVVGFCDNSPEKQGKKLKGLKIYSPQELTTLTFDKIVIASMYSSEIYPQLIGIGIPTNKLEIADSEIIYNNWGFPREEIKHLVKPYIKFITYAIAILGWMGWFFLWIKS